MAWRSVLASTCALMAIGAGAAGAEPYSDIASSGPLTQISIGQDLSCQVQIPLDQGLGEFYPSTSTPGDCGTILSLDGTVYTPDFANHDLTATGSLGNATPFGVGDQSPVTGAGSAADPYRLTTTVTAGDGVLVTEVDSYVVGQSAFQTDVTIANQSSGEVDGTLYRAGDCYLAKSDIGYGADAGGSGAQCASDAASPPLRSLTFAAITSGAQTNESQFADQWSEIASGNPFGGGCLCDGSVDSYVDDGAGLSWNVALPAGQTTTYSSRIAFGGDLRPPPPPPPPPAPTRHNVPIVLVPGLTEEADTVTPSTPCSRAGEFAATCQRLRNSGYAVYGIASTRGGGVGTLDNTGDLDANAALLTDFLNRTVGVPALLVGHSMGGLIARIAIARHGAPAAGLFTVGTPHDGSYLADVGVAAEALPCRVLSSCWVLQHALAAKFPVHSVAVNEMTRLARQDDRMPAPPVHVWTLAGTAITGHGSGYLFPDDIAVGQSSAHGAGANLGSRLDRIDLPLYHIDPGTLFGGLLHEISLHNYPPRTDNEFASPRVAIAIEDAGASLATFSRAGPRRVTPGDERKTSASATRPARRRLRMLTVMRAKAGRQTVAGIALAARPFDATCGGQTISALLLPGGVYALDASLTPCPAPVATLPREARATVAGNPDRVRGTIGRSGRSLTVILIARRRISSVSVTVGRRARRLRSGRSGRWTTTSLPHGTPLTLTARVGARTYRASLLA